MNIKFIGLSTFKNISFGEGTNLVWANNGDYAVRLGSYVKIISGYYNFLAIFFNKDKLII